MSNRTKLFATLIAVVVLTVAYFFFTSGYGKTTQLGYEFTQALYSACNQQDLERVRKIEMLINEYTDKQELPAKEKRWLDNIIRLAHEGQWKKAQRNARELLDAQVDAQSPAAEP